MVFQEPFGSLNPRWKVGRIVSEGLRLIGVSSRDAEQKALDFLKLVGLDRRAANRYPHEFSGGQRQRIALARAIALEPEVLVADEVTSTLDVSIQAQVLALLDDVRRQLNLALVIITHDLRVANQICDNIIVMRNGRIVESNSVREVFIHPSDSYTQMLLSSIPGRNFRQSAEDQST
jgi:peptide/nickel transport system ATP-binding protein